MTVIVNQLIHLMHLQRSGKVRLISTLRLVSGSLLDHRLAAQSTTTYTTVMPMATEGMSCFYFYLFWSQFPICNNCVTQERSHL